MPAVIQQHQLVYQLLMPVVIQRCSTNCQSPYLGTYIRNLCFDCNQNSDIFVPRTGETKQIRQVLVHGSVGMYPPRRQRQRRRRRWRQHQKTYLRQITCFCCRNKKEANTNYATTESFSVGMRKVRMNCFLISAVNVIQPFQKRSITSFILSQNDSSRTFLKQATVLECNNNNNSNTPTECRAFLNRQKLQNHVYVIAQAVLSFEQICFSFQSRKSKMQY